MQVRRAEVADLNILEQLYREFFAELSRSVEKTWPRSLLRSWR